MAGPLYEPEFSVYPDGAFRLAYPEGVTPAQALDDLEQREMPLLFVDEDSGPWQVSQREGLMEGTTHEGS